MPAPAVGLEPRVVRTHTAEQPPDGGAERGEDRPVVPGRPFHDRTVCLYPELMSVTAPTTLPAANEACWCGSGRKYKRCHKKSEGRILPGFVTPMRSVPASIGRPPYADTGAPEPWDEPRIKSPETIEKMRTAGRVAAEVLAPRRPDGRAGYHHRIDRRLRPQRLHRAWRLPLHDQLQLLPEGVLHVGQRGHLPRHPRLT